MNEEGNVEASFGVVEGFEEKRQRISKGSRCVTSNCEQNAK